MLSKTALKCIDYINLQETVSVFPAKQSKGNNATLPSLWGFLHPRSKFSWVWDDSGDSKVFKLWWLKNEIAASKQVIYGRFFSNQPVFLSLKKFHKLKSSKAQIKPQSNLERFIFDELSLNSPQTLRMIKKTAKKNSLEHTRNEWNKALLGLQKLFLVSSLGDSSRENGAMPSSEYAATDLFFK